MNDFRVVKIMDKGVVHYKAQAWLPTNFLVRVFTGRRYTWQYISHKHNKDDRYYSMDDICEFIERWKNLREGLVIKYINYTGKRGEYK